MEEGAVTYADELYENWELDMRVFALTSQFCDLDSPYKLQLRILES